MSPPNPKRSAFCPSASIYGSLKVKERMQITRLFSFQAGGDMIASSVTFKLEFSVVGTAADEFEAYARCFSAEISIFLPAA